VVIDTLRVIVVVAGVPDGDLRVRSRTTWNLQHNAPPSVR
jgi:hypothetical protein